MYNLQKHSTTEENKIIQKNMLKYFNLVVFYHVYCDMQACQVAATDEQMLYSTTIFVIICKSL